MLGRTVHGVTALATKGLRQFFGGHDQAAVGLAQQAGPGGVFLHQARNGRGAVIGEQAHRATGELGLVDRGNQAVVVAGDHQRLHRTVVNDGLQVAGHGAHQRHATVGGFGAHPAQSLVVEHGVVVFVAVPVHAQELDLKAAALQQVRQQTGHALAHAGGAGFGVGTGQPTQIAHVQQSDGLAIVGAAGSLTRRRCAAPLGAVGGVVHGGLT